MLWVLGFVTRLAILVGAGFVVVKTGPIMPNKVCRFVFLFLLFVPLQLVVNDFNVWLFGYHKFGLTVASVSALFLATLVTFVPQLFVEQRPRDSNTQ